MTDDVATIGEAALYTPKDGQPRSVHAVVELFESGEDVSTDHTHEIARGMARLFISETCQIPEKGDSLQITRDGKAKDFSILKLHYSTKTLAAVVLGFSIRARAVSTGDQADRFKGWEGRRR